MPRNIKLLSFLRESITHLGLQRHDVVARLVGRHRRPRGIRFLQVLSGRPVHTVEPHHRRRESRFRNQGLRLMYSEGQDLPFFREGFRFRGLPQGLLIESGAF